MQGIMIVNIDEEMAAWRFPEKTPTILLTVIDSASKYACLRWVK